MHLRIAVDLARRSEQKAGPMAFGEREEIRGPDDARQHGVLGIGLIMGRRCRAGEIEDAVDARAGAREAGRQAVDDVCVDHVEARLALEVPQVLQAPGSKVVETDYAHSGG
jgi:hypothetical protein